MKPITATNGTKSRRFISCVFFLTLGMCGVGLGQRAGTAISTLRITVRSEPITDRMGPYASLVSSRLQELDPTESLSAEDVRDIVSNHRSYPVPLPALTEGGTLMSTPDGLNFQIEDISVDPSRGVSAALGSDGNLYMRKSTADGQKVSDKGVVGSAASGLIIVSVVD